MRDNEPIDEIPSVAPASDEIASYNRSRGGRPAAASAGMGGGAKFFLFLAFVLAAAACAAAGYLYQELQKSGSDLQAATERISSLEEKLTSTGDSASESAALQGARIKELTSEVDKLWASAWRKNQAEIGQYSKQLNQQGSKLKQMESSVGTHKESLENLQAQLSEAQAMASSLKEVQSTSIAQQAQVSELEDGIAAMKVSVSGMQKKVKETEEWINSFNTFRRQTNSKLNQLEASRSSLPPPG